MRLLALRVRSFRKIAEAVFTFDPGLTVVIGPNEAGKSTLRHALLTALFASVGTTSARRRDEWRPWGSDHLGAVALEVEVEGRRLELRKDFERRRVEFRDLITGRMLDGQRAQEFILQRLGLPTEGLFRATAMIEQAEIASLAAGAADIGQRLSRIVQAGPGDAEAGKVIKTLEREIVELEKGTEKLAKTPGMIRRLDEEVAALRQQERELAGRIERHDAAARDLEQITATHREKGDALETRERLQSANREFLVIENELRGLRDRERLLSERVAGVETGLTQQAVVAHELEVLQAEGVPDDGAMAAIRGTEGRVERQREIVAGLHDAVRRTEARRAELDAADLHHGARGPRTALAGWTGLALVSLAVLLLAASLAGTAAGPAVLLTSAAAAGLGLLLLWGWRRLAGSRARARVERTQCEQALEQARTALEEAEAALLTEEETLRDAVRGTGSGTIEEARQRYETLRTLRETRAGVATRIETLLGGADLDGLRAERDRLRADIAGRETLLGRPENQAKRVTALEFQRLEEEVRRLTEDVHTLRARRHWLEQQVMQGAPDYEALAALRERLADHAELLEAARRRARVSRVVLDGLRTARQQTLIPARQRVEERAGEYLSLLTANAYSGVRIQEPPLKVTVWAPRADRWLEPQEPHLSRGTADQVYLAVRLALVEVLSEGRCPPLLLDDPFGTFDPDRVRAAMTLLRRVKERHQVLLFTCRPEYEAFADRVISMDDRVPTPEPEFPGPLWQTPPTTH